MAPFQSNPFVLYSAGDEKAIRVFEAPSIVLEGLSTLSGNRSAHGLLGDASSSSDAEQKPEGVNQKRSNYHLFNSIYDNISPCLIIQSPVCLYPRAWALQSSRELDERRRIERTGIGNELDK